MLFGLRTNAAQTFQRLMNNILRGLDFCFCYLNNILIASNNEEKQLKHLRIIFERLQNNGLMINVSKCFFGVLEIPFLGYLVSNQGIKPTSEKIKAINNYKKPNTFLELRQFLGIINYYRRHLKNVANNQVVLTEFLKDSRKRDRRLVPWTPETEKAFKKCKEKLMQVTTLTHAAPSVSLILTCDAFDLALGTSLEQIINGINKPIAFFSKKLNNSQRSYSVYDRELLGIYLTIQHFKYLLEGRKIIIKD